MSSLVLMVAFMALMAGANAQLVSEGQCPTNLNGLANFDAEKYAGKWYEVYRYGTDVFNVKADCFEIEFTWQPTVTLAPVKVGATYKVLPNKDNVLIMNGTAVQSTPAANPAVGEWLVSIPATSPPYLYKILSTDYTNYAIAYSCFNDNATHMTEYAWILLRSVDSVPSVDSTVAVISEAVRLNIKMTDLTAVEQRNEMCNGSSMFVPQVLLVAFVALYSLLK